MVISYSDFATNPSNPYYMHPNENPSLILIQPMLDNKNYQIWCRSMKVALISKNKVKFVDGTLSLCLLHGECKFLLGITVTSHMMQL